MGMSRRSFRYRYFCFKCRRSFKTGSVCALCAKSMTRLSSSTRTPSLKNKKAWMALERESLAFAAEVAAETDAKEMRSFAVETVPPARRRGKRKPLKQLCCLVNPHAVCFDCSGKVCYPCLKENHGWCPADEVPAMLRAYHKKCAPSNLYKCRGGCTLDWGC